MKLTSKEIIETQKSITAWYRQKERYNQIEHSPTDRGN